MRYVTGKTMKQLHSAARARLFQIHPLPLQPTCVMFTFYLRSPSPIVPPQTSYQTYDESLPHSGFTT